METLQRGCYWRVGDLQLYDRKLTVCKHLHHIYSIRIYRTKGKTECLRAAEWKNCHGTLNVSGPENLKPKLHSRFKIFPQSIKPPAAPSNVTVLKVHPIYSWLFNPSQQSVVSAVYPYPYVLEVKQKQLPLCTIWEKELSEDQIDWETVWSNIFCASKNSEPPINSF